MYTSLLIVKKLGYAWMYYPNGLTTGFAISKGYLTGDEVTGLVQIIEYGKTKRPDVRLTDIQVKDEYSGGAIMTFSSFEDLQQQLTIMGSPLMVETVGGASLDPDDNKFLSKPGFDIVDNLITVRPNWIWKLVGLTYTNPTAFPHTITYSSPGKSRIEYIIPNNSNGFTIVSGVESTGSPIAPQIPDNGLYVTFYQVTDNSISNPIEPIPGEDFVKKLESQDFIADYGATTVLDQINLIDDRGSISLINSITDLKSLQVATQYIRPGKPYFFKNRTGHDVKLWHNAGTGNVKISTPDSLDFIIKNNQVVQFSMNSNDIGNVKLELVGSSVDLSSKEDLSNKQNSLAIDGSGVKYITVDAVNAGLLEKTINSSGAVSGFAVTNNGDGTVNIESGFAFLKATNDPYAQLLPFTIPAVTNLALVDNANNFVLVDYNGGTPALTVTTSTATINTQTNSLAIAISRVGTTLDWLSLVGQNVDANAKLRIRFLNQEGIRRANGALIGFSARFLTLSAGTLFSGLIPIITPLFNTESSSTFTQVYNNGSVWTRTTGLTQVNNTQYNNAGTLTNLNVGDYRTDYIYLLPNNPSKLYLVLGTTSYANITAARTATKPSSLPSELQVLGLLVGRCIIQRLSANISEVSSAFDDIFANSGVPNHDDLAGLNAGNYQHLTIAEKSKLFKEELSYACSDETSDLTVGTLITFRIPFAMTLSSVRLSLNVAPTVTKLIVDVKENGVSIFSTLVSVDTGSTTSVGASVPAVISDTSLADDAVITISTTQVGSGTPGKGLKVTLIGTRT